MELEVRSRGELISKLQEVTLRGSDIKPYLQARIDLVTLDPCILAPTQRYVLTSELKKVEQVRWSILNEYHADILLLDGYIKCKYPAVPAGTAMFHENGHPAGSSVEESPAKTIDVIPPVVEEYFDPKGKLHLIIADGQHRCFLGRQMGSLITVAYVRGIHSSYKYYAYPLPDGWSDVSIEDTIPEGYIKKFHSLKEHKSRFRNYNSVFENIGDSRPYGK